MFIGTRYVGGRGSWCLLPFFYLCTSHPLLVPPGRDPKLHTFIWQKVVASAEELVFALTMLPLVLMVSLGIFRVDWGAVATPPAAGDVDWKLFIQIMFWTSTYWQKVGKKPRFVELRHHPPLRPRAA